MIELGGNIKLDGFNSLDIPTLIVVKKMVGNYAKKISDSIMPVNELILNLLEFDSNNKIFKLNASLVSEDKNFTSEAEDTNLFFALDKTLQHIINQAKKS